MLSTAVTVCNSQHHQQAYSTGKKINMTKSNLINIASALKIGVIEIADVEFLAIVRTAVVVGNCVVLLVLECL